MLEILKPNQILGCGNIARLTLDIDDGMIEDLKECGLENKSSLEDFIKNCIRHELERGDNMSKVSLNENVMEKVNLMSKLTDRTPEEVVNDTLWDNLRKIEDVPEIDGDKIWNMLEHDNPEGDDILDNLIRLGEEGWD